MLGVLSGTEFHLYPKNVVITLPKVPDGRLVKNFQVNSSLNLI